MIYKNDLHIPYETKINDFPCLKFRSLEDTGLVRHLFTTREGGVSSGIYESMNLSYARGDIKENVDKNFAIIAGALGVEVSDIISTDQTHTANVRIVGKADCGHGITKDKYFFDIDGIVTNEPGIVLSAYYADCVPLYFLDPAKKVIGLSHSGWKGTVGKIGKNTIELMKETYGCNPSDILCCIGPSICQDCYEVSQDLYDAFDDKSVFIKTSPEGTATEDTKYHLDLWTACEHVFLDAGILPEHIEKTTLCTCCNKDKLFSHRGSKGNRGNLGAFLGLL